MSRVVASLLLVVMSSSVALAQYAPPPQPAPQPYPPQPQPYAPQPQPYPQPYPPQPQPQPYAPQPYNYQPQPVQISAEDAEILNRGPISDGAHIGGGLVALFFGFGVGQAVQGRYGDTGWIFTVGEGASLGLMIYGIGRLFDDCINDGYDTYCDNDGNAGPFVVGMLGLMGFRIWEVVDAFAGPASHNRRYKDVQLRVNGYAPPQWGIYSARTMDRQASVMGLELKF